MTHSTLERPSFTPEAKKASRLELSDIMAIDKLPERSPFELRTLGPTADRPVAIYLAAPKEEDQDTMRGSLIAMKENADAPNSMDVFWQVDPDAMSIVRARANSEIEQMGVGDDASVAGTFKIERGDKLFFITNQRLEALKSSGQFTSEGIDLVLDNENERQEIIEITLDGAAASLDTSASTPVASQMTPRDVEELKLMRKNKKKNNDRKRARKEGITTPGDEVSSSPAATPVAPTVTPMVFAQSKRAPIRSTDAISHPSGSTSQEEVDAEEERQQKIDAKRGFTIINKRVRSREELLYTPLDELIAGIDASKLTNHNKSTQAAPGIKASVTPVPAAEKKPSSTPTPATAATPSLASSTDTMFVPTPDGHEPLVYGPENKPATLPTIDPDNKDKFSLGSALNDAMGKMHAHFSAANFIRRNNRQPRNPEKEKRLKKAAIWATMGAVGIVAWKMNPEWQSSFGDALDAIVPGASDAMDGVTPGAINTGEGSNQGLDTKAGMPQSDIIDQRTIDLRTEVLESPAHVIPAAGGGEAYAAANGADIKLWYQNQGEFLRQFPNEAYVMLDGNVGFKKPGELSDAAKEYWAKKFGQWR